MNTTLGLVLLVVLVALVVVAVSMYFTRRKRSAELREHFGPEYDRTVTEYGAQSKAEAELAARRERVQQLHIRPLSSDQRSRYAEQWRAIQAQFVDNPEQAIAAADQLLIEVMQTRGYPMGDFEQRAADVSVEHPDVVEHYRAAHAVGGRAADGQTSTEDLRQAMVHYRYLFDDLIEAQEPNHVEARQ